MAEVLYPHQTFTDYVSNQGSHFGMSVRLDCMILKVL